MACIGWLPFEVSVACEETLELESDEPAARSVLLLLDDEELSFAPEDDLGAKMGGMVSLERSAKASNQPWLKY